MDEQIIADRQMIDEAVEEIDIRARNIVQHPVGDSPIIHVGAQRKRQAVAGERFHAADPPEEADRALVAARSHDKNLFMIALEQPDVAARSMQRPDPLDHLRRMRSTIDQITEQDEAPTLSRPQRIVGRKHAEQLVEQVEPAMNVADRIDAPVIPTLGGSPSSSLDRRRNFSIGRAMCASWPAMLPQRHRRGNVTPCCPIYFPARSA